MDIHVVEVAWATHRERLCAVRKEVFVDEQNVPEQLEFDGEDADATHFIALNEAGFAVGTARLLGTGQIGRMAVLKPSRRRGIGRRLLDLAIAAAEERGLQRVFLHAQTYATEFYRRAGFIVEGEEFTDAGIAHVQMYTALPRPQPPEHSTWLFEDTDACRAVLIRILSLGRRRLRLYSQHLDYQLLDQPMVVEALSNFARTFSGAVAQVLIHDSAGVVNRGHRIIELARRMPSKIKIRKVMSEYADEDRSWVIADDSTWILPDHREHAGVASSYNPVDAERLRQDFDRIWERSLPDPELRALKL